ncbi:glutathione S-transferase family protein [Facilibium subflavum]|uniref:glutathione S-transferase family protein n=1 Tax=Facilibium subflavum TaxID=2219058 RepID=UPI000E649685|nr:glutathione S-transferase family protein [Facilibium subflavum]
MGMLINGQWQKDENGTISKDGKFKREASAFKHTIGQTGKFTAEKNRYHLYISYACPWAHRALIARKLKKLEDIISVSITEPLLLENGWEFGQKGDPLYHKSFLYQIYTIAQPDYTGRVTVPVLWDKKHKTIVNNESADILRIFNSAFNHITHSTLDLYPEDKRDAIDNINEKIYHNVNNGVYKAGFATTQSAYDEAVTNLFNTLDELEKHLSDSKYLVGESPTEADWRLFTTLVRFDPVYHGHFKCNIRLLALYPNLYNYLKALYQIPGIAETVNFSHIKKGYYGSHKKLNPTGIIPKGPIIDLDSPYHR